MVYQRLKILIILLFLFYIPALSFAFDANSTHPALTEEIVKYYNSFAERKITYEELELLKQGSMLEDRSPRWVNHFYDVFNNSGINWNTVRGVSQSSINFFKKLLPHLPLKSPDWAQDEIVQSKYLDNRAYQRAKRLYFENKKEAFLTLGYILHLLEDLGVPEHARGDAHGGFSTDPKSNYEDYAKSITDNYNLNFARELIKNKTQPYKFNDINSIFASLAKFTASNWFSEDTVNFLPLPHISVDAALEQCNSEQKECYVLYYKNRDFRMPILKEYSRGKFTTNDEQIHQSWFNSVVPEILKHGVALLNLYFSEIKDMEKEEAIKLYEEDIGRMVKLANFFGFFNNIQPHVLVLAWRGAEKIYNTGLFLANAITGFLNPTPPAPKFSYSFKAEESGIKPTQQPDEFQKIYEKRLETSEPEVSYQERRSNIEDRREVSENKTPLIFDEQTKITNSTTPTPENESITTTTPEESSDYREDKGTKEEPKFIYGGGGSRRDPCDDYKNKNYSNILISEIQFETKEDSDDEFIELYNPNDKEIDLTCWILEKYASKQDSNSIPTLTTLIPSSKFQGIIKPYSFFLITSSSTKEKYQGDLSYAQSYSIAKNNTIILKKPNGEISDLVGYGDDQEKIYQSETSPFLAKNFKNKSIQRKNLTDTNNNSEDFWLHLPNPENSNISRKPREDFADLTQARIENFRISVTSTEEETTLDLTFQEPTFNISSTNYAYELLISTSTEFSTFSLEDFGATSTLPRPQFNSLIINFQAQITKCPVTSTLYYFGLYLKDLLDNENRTDFTISSTTLPEELCNPGEIIVSNTSSSPTSTGRVLISEIRVLEGNKPQDNRIGEFIELYNPNDFDIDLTGWEIVKINKNGRPTTIVPSSKFKGVIPAFSYFLLVNADSLPLNVEPDIIYPRSYDLAKKNSIQLYDKDRNLVDEFSWNEVDNLKSFNRKKTVDSNENNLFQEELNLGNAYDTDQISDFLLAQPNPENSKVKKETIKKIKNFKIETTMKTYKFSWFSPAFYDQELIYELSFSTSSEFSTATTLATSSFYLLTNQNFELNLCPQNLVEPIYSDSIIFFYLRLKKGEKEIATTSNYSFVIDCRDISNNFQLRKPSFSSGSFAEYKVLNDVNLEEIYILNQNLIPGMRGESRSFSIFTSLKTKITKLISTTTENNEDKDKDKNKGKETTIEIEVFSTTTFEQSPIGCARENSPRLDYYCDAEPSIVPGMGQSINWYFTLNKVPVNISLNKEDIIRIYATYEESLGIDDGWWVEKFRGF